MSESELNYSNKRPHSQQIGSNDETSSKVSVQTNATTRTGLFSGGYSRKNKTQIKQMEEILKKEVLEKSKQDNQRLKQLQKQSQQRLKKFQKKEAEERLKKMEERKNALNLRRKEREKYLLSNLIKSNKIKPANPVYQPKRESSQKQLHPNPQTKPMGMPENKVKNKLLPPKPPKKKKNDFDNLYALDLDLSQSIQNFKMIENQLRNQYGQENEIPSDSLEESNKQYKAAEINQINIKEVMLEGPDFLDSLDLDIGYNSYKTKQLAKIKVDPTQNESQNLKAGVHPVEVKAGGDIRQSLGIKNIIGYEDLGPKAGNNFDLKKVETMESMDLSNFSPLKRIGKKEKEPLEAGGDENSSLKINTNKNYKQNLRSNLQRASTRQMDHIPEDDLEIEENFNEIGAIEEFEKNFKYKASNTPNKMNKNRIQMKLEKISSIENSRSQSQTNAAPSNPSQINKLIKLPGSANSPTRKVDQNGQMINSPRFMQNENLSPKTDIHSRGKTNFENVAFNFENQNNKHILGNKAPMKPMSKIGINQISSKLESDQEKMAPIKKHSEHNVSNASKNKGPTHSYSNTKNGKQKQISTQESKIPTIKSNLQTSHKKNEHESNTYQSTSPTAQSNVSSKLGNKNKIEELNKKFGNVNHNSKIPDANRERIIKINEANKNKAQENRILPKGKIIPHYPTKVNPMQRKKIPSTICTRDDDLNVNEFIMNDLKEINKEEKEIQESIIDLHLQTFQKKNVVFAKNAIRTDIESSKQLYDRLAGNSVSSYSAQGNNPIQELDEEQLMESINNIEYLLVQQKKPVQERQQALDLFKTHISNSSQNKFIPPKHESQKIQYSHATKSKEAVVTTNIATTQNKMTHKIDYSPNKAHLLHYQQIMEKKQVQPSFNPPPVMNAPPPSQQFPQEFSSYQHPFSIPQTQPMNTVKKASHSPLRNQNYQVSNPHRNSPKLIGPGQQHAMKTDIQVFEDSLETSAKIHPIQIRQYAPASNCGVDYHHQMQENVTSRTSPYEPAVYGFKQGGSPKNLGSNYSYSHPQKENFDENKYAMVKNMSDNNRHKSPKFREEEKSPYRSNYDQEDRFSSYSKKVMQSPQKSEGGTSKASINTTNYSKVQCKDKNRTYSQLHNLRNLKLQKQQEGNKGSPKKDRSKSPAPANNQVGLIKVNQNFNIEELFS